MEDKTSKKFAEKRAKEVYNWPDGSEITASIEDLRKFFTKGYLDCVEQTQVEQKEREIKRRLEESNSLLNNP